MSTRLEAELRNHIQIGEMFVEMLLESELIALLHLDWTLLRALARLGRGRPQVATPREAEALTARSLDRFSKRRADS